ncbi:hypothetical protein [uncultured Devosia sp.]|uniref:hypothetical protein n=1 Tax=uncultured Devosia sp. TaxID=211434 RepID=UPI00261B4B84|nr:hypothetical protein [uncultured Devosia sp.]
MKLTWFGSSTFRVQTGGQVIALDPEGAPAGVDRSELVSGADRVVRAADSLVDVDPAIWRPRPTERLLDAADGLRPVEIWSVGPSGLLLDGDDDVPLLLLGGPVPELGRWVEKAAVVMFGADLAGRCHALLQGQAPGLVAVAGSDREIDAVFADIPNLLDGTGLIALEPGLAVEA